MEPLNLEEDVVDLNPHRLSTVDISLDPPFPRLSPEISFL